MNNDSQLIRNIYIQNHQQYFLDESILKKGKMEYLLMQELMIERQVNSLENGEMASIKEYICWNRIR